MGRKKSKRPTKDTTRQNRSDASTSNSVSADSVASGSSRSTSRNAATANVSENRNATRNPGSTAVAAASIRGNSSQSAPRNTVSALSTNSRNRGAQAVSVTDTRNGALQSVSRNVSAATTPETRRLSNSSQTATRISVSTNTSNQRSSVSTSTSSQRSSVSTSTSNQRSQVSQTTSLVTNTVDRDDPILYPIFFIIRFADGSQMGECFSEMTSYLRGLLGREEIDLTILNDKCTLLFKAKSQVESNTISNVTSFNNRRITVRPHSGLNSSQGTIYEKGIVMNSNEEILNHLRSQHVTKVYRFRKKVNGVTVNTPRLLLTFDTPQPPKQIKVAFTWHQIRLFSPTPRRCFNCQSFKHPSKYCTSPPICPLCAEPGHTYPPRCNKPLKCSNCSGDHPAISPQCPVFKAEKKIQLLHARDKIGIYKARQLVNTEIVREMIAADSN